MEAIRPYPGRCCRCSSSKSLLYSISPSSSPDDDVVVVVGSSDSAVNEPVSYNVSMTS